MFIACSSQLTDIMQVRLRYLTVVIYKRITDIVIFKYLEDGMYGNCMENICFRMCFFFSCYDYFTGTVD